MSSCHSSDLPFEYQIEYGKGRRRIEIDIRESNKIVVMAPPEAKKEEIYKILSENADKICEELAVFRILKGLYKIQNSKAGKKNKERTNNTVPDKKFPDDITDPCQYTLSRFGIDSSGNNSNTKNPDYKDKNQIPGNTGKNQNSKDNNSGKMDTAGRNRDQNKKNANKNPDSFSSGNADYKRPAEDDTLHQGSVKVGSMNIPFVVEYGKRRRKISFEIREGPQVVVTAPYGADRDEIYSVLKTNGGWLATNYRIIEKSGMDGKAGLSVVYRGKTYNYTVKYLKRAVRYALKIHEDNSIEVTAPAPATKEDVELFVKNSASFIHEKINDPERIVARPMEFRDGGSVLIKGDEVQIKTIRSHTCKEPELKEGILTVTLPHEPKEDEARIKWEISRFLQNLTFKEVNRYLPEYAGVLRLPVPDIDIRFYRRCWGKCRPGRNQVIFNERLAMLPADLIEYVVAHEMCHFYHPNHGKEFYNTLHLIMPDADERKKRTKRYRIDLIKDE